MKTKRKNRIIGNNIDKLRILEDGYFICYYLDDKSIMYTIRSKIRNIDTFRYLGILWGPISSDYVDDFIENLYKTGKYNNFIESIDPFIYIWNNNLIYKTRQKSSNLFKSDNEYTLISERMNNKYFCYPFC